MFGHVASFVTGRLYAFSTLAQMFLFVLSLHSLTLECWLPHMWVEAVGVFSRRGLMPVVSRPFLA